MRVAKTSMARTAAGREKLSEIEGAGWAVIIVGERLVLEPEVEMHGLSAQRTSRFRSVRPCGDLLDAPKFPGDCPRRIRELFRMKEMGKLANRQNFAGTTLFDKG